MTKQPLSGTLGNMQLVAFVGNGNAEAVNDAARELGFTHTHVAAGGAVEAASYLGEHASPEILLVEVQSADAAPAELDVLADVVNPHTRVFVTGKIDSIRFYQWLADLGIAGYVLQPFTAAELTHAIAKGGGSNVAKVDVSNERPQKMVAVIGARGGVGTTTVATNLGALFAREHNLPTAIVDLDPYFGSVALNLDLEPGRGLRDAFEKPERIDALFLERVMVKPFANLSIFSAEEPLSDAIHVQPNAGELMFAALREKFNLMVVDLPRQMSPLSRYVLNQADHVVIVAEPQLTSLRDSLRLKDYLVDQLKRPTPMLLLNRVGESTVNELSPKEFAKNFGQDAAGKIAFLTDIMAATAQGELLSHAPKLNAALAPLRKIAERITGNTATTEDEPAPASGGLLARLKGR